MEVRFTQHLRDEFGREASIALKAKRPFTMSKEGSDLTDEERSTARRMVDKRIEQVKPEFDANVKQLTKAVSTCRGGRDDTTDSTDVRQSSGAAQRT